jgi:hypothetical protein
VGVEEEQCGEPTRSQQSFIRGQLRLTLGLVTRPIQARALLLLANHLVRAWEDAMKKGYEKPQVIYREKIEARAGSCNQADSGCTTVVS